jgi:hypothetical protein
MSGKARRKKQRRRGHRAVKMSEEMYHGLAGQLEAFQEKFTRALEPSEPMLFDPEADRPKVISEEVIHRELTSAAVKAGIDPSIIYAMNKTGMILVGGKEDHWSEEDLAEWDAAIEEYDSLNSKEPC